MDTTKTSPEAFKLYKRWEKALLASTPELPKGCSKMGLVAYCFTMAVHGTNGVDCFASDQFIANELGVYHYETVSKYRHLAIELGWLEPSGKSHGRVQGLNIAIPSGKPAVVTVADSPRSPERPTSASKPAGNGCEHRGRKVVYAVDGVAECQECGKLVPWQAAA